MNSMQLLIDCLSRGEQTASKSKAASAKGLMSARM